MSASDVTAAAGSSDGVRGIPAIREHPEWYFRGARFASAEMLALLVSEATTDGAEDIEVRHVDGWWVVASTYDWLDGSITPFFALVSDAELGANTARVEILLTAFCPIVWTARHGESYDVTVSGQPPAAVAATLHRSEYARVIAFAPPDLGAGDESRPESQRRLSLVEPRATLDAAFTKVVKYVKDAQRHGEA